MQRTLVEAQRLALSYGRRHLGHYSDLNLAALHGDGLTVPDGVDVDVIVDHHAFCVVTTSDALPAGQGWQRGSIATTSRAPEPGDTACRR